jgi:hypothetical protein
MKETHKWFLGGFNLNPGLKEFPQVKPQTTQIHEEKLQNI